MAAWSASIAAEQQNNTLIGLTDTRQRSYSIGTGYDFGPAKVVAAYRQTNNQPQGAADYKDKTYTLGASAPVGAAGVVKASYNRYERNNVAALETQKADQYSLGYEHNLSKRTALYGTYSYLKNKNGGTMSLVADAGAGLSSSGKQQAVQLGVRHSF